MSDFPAVEVKLLVEDSRWPSYREALEQKRADAVKAILRRGLTYERMTRIAGEISALDFALGVPAELEKLDPESQTP